MPKMRLIVKNRPKEYPATSQQLKFKEVTKFCGIRKGITKAQLQKQMKECVGPLMRGDKLGNKR